ncbi:hypothetical protein DQ04_00441000 [Trypanosoma grayi]|uniref:hypothetical protein n=1 Tax=Trypanosoma grayi TaxID=71804 RepID=UPI0004F434F5|nr:hypothetical protein DQ04_00441000 [Trypanosoma grayi]KEG14475.1 hypothetical protein DQ04_00441000 [Trypanosoma grayi]
MMRETENMSGEDPSFRCLECLNVFPTWTKLTQHLERTMHFSARCVECDLQLRCYGPSQPYRHEETTGHRGISGVFYTRLDYRLDQPPVLAHPQYRCECRVSFVSSLHIALHLRTDHGVTSVPDEATCLTCKKRGTLAEMATHRLERLLAKENCVFDIPGFVASRYLVSRPRLPPWPAQEKPYIVLYQCPLCSLLFLSWNDMQQHIATTGHCRDVLPSTAVCLSRAQYGTGGHALSSEDFEVLVDKSDPKLCALIQRSLPEGSGTGSDDDDLVLGFQCPEESCRRLFLTHGELLDHMEMEGHHPNTHEEEKGDPGQTVPSWKWDVSAYEVMCSTKQLVELFGFSSCPHCSRAVTAGAEMYHQQLFHPEK